MKPRTPPAVDAIRLPIPYDELFEFCDSFVVEGAPMLRDKLAQDLGVRFPTLTRNAKKTLTSRVKAQFLSVRGYLLAQEILGNKIPPALAAYAVWEGQARQAMQLRDTERHPDALQALRRRLQRAARPSPSQNRLHGYAETRNAVDRLAHHAVERTEDVAFRNCFASWFESSKARQVLQSIERLKAAEKSWRLAVPKRLTQHVINQLTHEYRDLSAIFELHLARMVGIALGLDGSFVSWDQVYGANLFWLQDTATRCSAHPELGFIASAIRRDVRNALAHGVPVLNVRAKRIEFQPKGRTVESWSAEEFFTATSKLRAGVVAMYQFDSQVQYLSHERLLAYYTAAIRAETAGIFGSNPKASADS